jgi:hypothetical protein
VGKNFSEPTTPAARLRNVAGSLQLEADSLHVQVSMLPHPTTTVHEMLILL